MTVSATTLRLLMEVGVTGEALLRVVESIEKDNAKSVTPRNANAERQARFRAKKRVTEITLPVTPRTRARGVVSSSSTEDSGKKEKKTRAIPVEAWTPSDDLKAWATAQGFTTSLLTREIDKLRDWARGKGEVKRDWNAAARNWLRRVAEEMGLKPVEAAPGAGTIEIHCHDPRWDALADRYEREHGRNLRHAQKWPFPESWIANARV